MYLSVYDIMETVANAYDLTVGNLKGPRKSKQFSHPRMIAMWLAAELLTDKSLPQLGRAFNRDHTTVLHARKRGRAITAENEVHIYNVTFIIGELRRKAGFDALA